MARVTISSVSLNSIALSGTALMLPAATPGCDATGTGSAFATWTSLGITGGAAGGVQFVNNGTLFLLVTNGATASTAQVLVGRKGGAGFLPAFTTETVTIPASSAVPIPIGPLSVLDYTQTDSSQYSGSSGGVVGTSGVGMTCVDFTSTATIAVRLYQLIPALP
jgi:hypothetical protein